MPECITSIADFTGDSYALAVKAKSAPQSNILMCGVRFMAETVKMLAPEKRVYLSNKNAGCPMAEQFSAEYVKKLKEENPDYTVVAYVNTTAELKAVADVCVTSSSAVKVCKALPNKNILFIPDENLGTYVQSKVPEKNFKFVKGYCRVHVLVDGLNVMQAKKLHPNAELLVHPECIKEVCDSADYVGSTSGIMNYAINSKNKEFIIGTETAIVEHLEHICPDKKFYPLSEYLRCKNMKLTTLEDILNCLKGNGCEINLDEKLRVEAAKSVEKMIELGG